MSDVLSTPTTSHDGAGEERVFGFATRALHAGQKPDPATGERRGVQGFGYEYELYRKIHGAWKIAGWRLYYIRMDPLPRTPLPDRVLGGPEVLRDKQYIAAVTAR